MTPTRRDSGGPRDYPAMARAAAPLASLADRTAQLEGVVDVLWQGLSSSGLSWVGFYLDQPGEPEDARLVLGPRHPKPACSPIGLHGVCGQSLRGRCVRIVSDVSELGPDYIACDPRDRSEIVIPILDRAADGSPHCWAVLDLDSHEVGCFDQADALGLQDVLRAAGVTRV